MILFKFTNDEINKIAESLFSYLKFYYKKEIHKQEKEKCIKIIYGILINNDHSNELNNASTNKLNNKTNYKQNNIDNELNLPCMYKLAINDMQKENLGGIIFDIVKKYLYTSDKYQELGDYTIINDIDCFLRGSIYCTYLTSKMLKINIIENNQILENIISDKANNVLEKYIKNPHDPNNVSYPHNAGNIYNWVNIIMTNTILSIKDYNICTNENFIFGYNSIIAKYELLCYLFNNGLNHLEDIIYDTEFLTKLNNADDIEKMKNFRKFITQLNDSDALLLEKAIDSCIDKNKNNLSKKLYTYIGPLFNDKYEYECADPVKCFWNIDMGKVFQNYCQLLLNNMRLGGSLENPEIVQCFVSDFSALDEKIQQTITKPNYEFVFGQTKQFSNNSIDQFTNDEIQQITNLFCEEIKKEYEIADNLINFDNTIKTVYNVLKKNNNKYDLTYNRLSKEEYEQIVAEVVQLNNKIAQLNNNNKADKLSKNIMVLDDFYIIHKSLTIAISKTYFISEICTIDEICKIVADIPEFKRNIINILDSISTLDKKKMLNYDSRIYASIIDFNVLQINYYLIDNLIDNSIQKNKSNNVEIMPNANAIISQKIKNIFFKFNFINNLFIYEIDCINYYNINYNVPCFIKNLNDFFIKSMSNNEYFASNYVKSLLQINQFSRQISIGIFKRFVNGRYQCYTDFKNNFHKFIINNFGQINNGEYDDERALTIYMENIKNNHYPTLRKLFKIWTSKKKNYIKNVYSKNIADIEYNSGVEYDYMKDICAFNIVKKNNIIIIMCITCVTCITGFLIYLLYKKFKKK